MTELGEAAFSESSFDGSVIIGNGLIEIKRNTFRDCSSLNATLKLGENLEEIGSYAFYGCEKLKGNLVIPEKVTYVSNYAFCGCVGFEGYLTLGSNVTEIGYYAFTTVPEREEETKTVNATNYKVRTEEVNALNFSTIYCKSATPPQITENRLRTSLSTTVYVIYYNVSSR